MANKQIWIWDTDVLHNGEKQVQLNTYSVQFSSVAQSCLTLCDPVNDSTPGLPVHHQHPELTQTHVHWVGDAIQPSHPLLFPSPPAPNPSQLRVFSNESTLHMRWPKYWSFNSSISLSNAIISALVLYMIKKKKKTNNNKINKTTDFSYRLA